jgi:hypothetical protein
MYIVLTKTMHGHEGFWTDGDDNPLAFHTREEAQKEIDDLVEEMGYDPEDYKIEEIK